MNYNSIKNQEIKRDFVSREIRTGVTDMMFDILNQDDGLYTYDDIGNFWDEEYNESKEILEWWIVTEWLGEKLKDKGECIMSRTGGYLWGRTCSGQAILSDNVISGICEEMGLLK